MRGGRTREQPLGRSELSDPLFLQLDGKVGYNHCCYLLPVASGTVGFPSLSALLTQEGRFMIRA